MDQSVIVSVSSPNSEMLNNTIQNVSRPVRFRRPRSFFGDSQQFVPRRVVRPRNNTTINSESSVNANALQVNNRNEVANNQLENNINIPIINNANALEIYNINEVENDQFENNIHIPIIHTPNLDIHNVIIEPAHPIHDDMQVGFNVSVESVNLKNDLLLAASGVVPVIALGNQPSMRHTMNNFIDGIFKNVLKLCTVCKKRWFSEAIHLDNAMPFECTRCLKEKKESLKNNINFVPTMSASNNMDPFYRPSQIALDEYGVLERCFALNSQEQALISISTPIMSFLKLKGPRDSQNIEILLILPKILLKYVIYYHVCLLNAMYLK